MNILYIAENNISEEYTRLLKQINSKLNPKVNLPSEIEQQKWTLIYKNRLSKILVDRKEKMKSVIQYGTPRLTYLFIIINFVMFLILEFSGGSMNVETLINYAANYNTALLEGEWWHI